MPARLASEQPFASHRTNRRYSHGEEGPDPECPNGDRDDGEKSDHDVAHQHRGGDALTQEGELLTSRRDSFDISGSFLLAFSQGGLGHPDQLNDRKSRGASEAAGATFDAVEDERPFHLLEASGAGQTSESRGVEVLGAGLDATATPNARVFLGQAAFALGESEESGGALEHGDV